MKDKKDNIFKLPTDLPQQELLETLLDTDKLLILRIVSTGQVTPPEEWYYLTHIQQPHR